MSSGLLIGLIIIWFGAYVAGLLTRKPDRHNERRIPLWTKLVMISITLIMAGFWVSRFYPHINISGIYLLMGIIFCALGDLILADVFSRHKQTVITAMVVFGIGHLFFVMTVFSIRSRYELSWMGAFITIVVGVLIALVGWRLLVYLPGGNKKLNTGSLIYGMLLFVTTALIVGLWVESGSHVVFAIGIGLFAISDVILAQSLIRKQSTPFLRDAVWFIYSGGQMLIAYALGEILTLSNV